MCVHALVFVRRSLLFTLHVCIYMLKVVSLYMCHICTHKRLCNVDGNIRMHTIFRKVRHILSWTAEFLII